MRFASRRPTATTFLFQSQSNRLPPQTHPQLLYMLTSHHFTQNTFPPEHIQILLASILKIQSSTMLCSSCFSAHPFTSLTAPASPLTPFHSATSLTCLSPDCSTKKGRPSFRSKNKHVELSLRQKDCDSSQKFLVAKTETESSPSQSAARQGNICPRFQLLALPQSRTSFS